MIVLPCCCLSSVALGFPLMVFLGLWLWLWWRARRAATYVVPETNTNSVIVVTGCDSGIGRTTALGLVQAGFHVVATTFTKAGPASLRAEAAYLEGELSTVHVDITKEESVAQLVTFLEALLAKHPLKNLAGLLNNAGVILPGPVETQPIHLFEKQIEVNLFGHVRVTQALLPFIRRDARTLGGRVVNLVSVAGRVSTYFLGAYAGSKFGMEAVTDSLRRELRSFGVSVSAIEPGFVQTPLLHNLGRDLLDQNQDEKGRALYKEFFDRVEKNNEQVYLGGSSPELVASNIVHALTSPRPKSRYLVGTDAHIMALLQWLLPSSIADELLVMVEDRILD